MVTWDCGDGADEEGPDGTLGIVCGCCRGEVLVGFVARSGIDALGSHVSEEVDYERGDDLDCVGMPLVDAAVRVQGLRPDPYWAWDRFQFACWCGRRLSMLGEVCIQWLLGGRRFMGGLPASCSELRRVL